MHFVWGLPMHCNVSSLIANLLLLADMPVTCFIEQFVLRCLCPSIFPLVLIRLYSKEIECWTAGNLVRWFSDLLTLICKRSTQLILTQPCSCIAAWDGRGCGGVCRCLSNSCYHHFAIPSIKLQEQFFFLFQRKRGFLPKGIWHEWRSFGMQIGSAKMVVNIDRVLIEMLMCRDGASCRPSTASTYSSPPHG